MAVSTPRAHERAKAMAVSRERFPMPAGYGGAWPGTEPMRRATHQQPGAAGVEGAGGTGGHGRASRSTIPSRRLACGDLAGGRARRRPKHQRSRKQQAQSLIPAVPPVRRAPEGPQGLAAVPVGGGGAWPGFETTRRAQLAARTARGRAAAHGHTEQPGPQDSACGTRNTSGATSTTERRSLRTPRSTPGSGRPGDRPDARAR